MVTKDTRRLIPTGMLRRRALIVQRTPSMLSEQIASLASLVWSVLPPSVKAVMAQLHTSLPVPPLDQPRNNRRRATLMPQALLKGKKGAPWVAPLRRAAWVPERPGLAEVMFLTQTK